MSWNPYQGKDFFAVIFLMIKRLFLFIRGEELSVAPDELQFLVLSGIAISSALVGTWLVLKRLAMLANSLSHTTLLGIILVFIISRYQQGGELKKSLDFMDLMGAALISGTLTVTMTQFLSRWIRLQEDASNGIVFTFLFALGIVLVTLFSRNAHIGVELILGNVDMLHIKDLSVTYLVAGLNLILVTFFYRAYFATTFDELYAKTQGISVSFFQYFLLFQVSLTSVSAFRAVGVLMVLAFIVGLPLIARFYTDKLHHMLSIAALLGILISLFGVAFSRHLYTRYFIPLSTGGVVVSTILVVFVLTFLISPKRGYLWTVLRR